MSLSQVKIAYPEDVPEFYANFVQILSSQWDFVLALGSTKVVPSPGSKGPRSGPDLQGTAEVEVIIRMSPQHAKETARMLSGLVESYEQQWGKMGIEQPADEEGANDATE